MDLLLGTSNRGKVAELVELFAPTALRLISLADLDKPPEIAETGRTLAENAALKAAGYARHFGLWTLGDDTGLCVDALGGAPGLHTARFAGPTASAQDNRRRLMEALAGVCLEQRAAHFVCHLCLADPSGRIRTTSEGRCFGRIRDQPAGENGFGYDPLFEVIEYHRTFAELGLAATAVISHRARAAAKMLDDIAQLTGKQSTLFPNRERA